MFLFLEEFLALLILIIVLLFFVLFYYHAQWGENTTQKNNRFISVCFSNSNSFCLFCFANRNIVTRSIYNIYNEGGTLLPIMLKLLAFQRDLLNFWNSSFSFDSTFTRDRFRVSECLIFLCVWLCVIMRENFIYRLSVCIDLVSFVLWLRTSGWEWISYNYWIGFRFVILNLLPSGGCSHHILFT